MMDRPKVFTVLVTLGWLVLAAGALTGMVIMLRGMGDEDGSGAGAGFVVVVQAVISGTLLIGLGRIGQVLADMRDSLVMLTVRQRP